MSAHRAPADETELAQTVAEAASRRAPVEIAGGATRGGLGRPVQAEATLSTAKIRGIRLYEPGALTMVAAAGTPLAEIEAALEPEGQMLPFEPIDHRALYGTTGEPTLGGMVAAAASGPRRISAGACRDALLGLRFVDGTGTAVANGGRVMKNVTGYDLVKLMAGSHGTLGVLTEIALKLAPRPEAEATLIRRGLSTTAGISALSAALGAPYGVSGAAHLEVGAGDGQSETRVRIEGLADSVAYRAEQLGARLGAEWERAEGASSAALWRELSDVTPLAGRPGAVWRVSLRPGDAASLSEGLRAAGLEPLALYDWGGGLVWLLLPEEGDAGAAEIRGRIEVLGGHATLVRAGAAIRSAIPVFQPEPEPLARIAAGIRARFDPAGILNPGRMGT